MLYEDILQQFKERLYELQQKHTDYLKQAHRGIELCRETLDKLKEAVLEHNFTTKQGEIRFFRDIKMEPMRYLIYYINVRNFKQRMPKVGQDPKSDFFDSERDRVNNFFNEHLNFQIYMEQGLGHSDKKYFTRKYLNEFPLVFEDDYYRDPEFNTAFDKLWSTIKGMALYGHYLDRQKKELDIKNGAGPKASKRLELTLKKSWIIELMYALFLVGGFNNGNVSLKEMADFIKEHFGVDLGDYSHTFHRFRERLNPTLFLDLLKSKLTSYMQGLDG